VRINGDLTADFDLLSKVLDDSVGKTVKLGIERGGEVLEREPRSRTCIRYAGPVPRIRRWRRPQLVVAAGAPHQRADPRRLSRTPATILARPACRTVLSS
jgi:hypothetical protein